MALPKFPTQDQASGLLQTTWASMLDPVLKNPITQGVLLQSVVLASGTNVINHRLGRKLVGWVPIRLRASATIYDTQDTNQHPDLTLQLTASAAATVDIYVF